MIFISLTDGTTTHYMTSYESDLVDELGGYTYDDIFYKPQVKNPSNVKFSADNIDRMSDFRITIDVEGFPLFASRNLTCSVSIWDEEADTTPIHVFDGRAIRTGASRTEITYQIKTDRGVFASDLLAPAPDVKQFLPVGFTDADFFNVAHVSNTYESGRVFPVHVGLLKHVEPFPLTLDGGGGTGLYYTDGSVTQLYDNGLTLRHAQHVDYRVTQNDAYTAPVYIITMDINGATQVPVVETTAPIVLPTTWTFYQAAEPLSADYVLKEGMVWFDSDDNNKEYRHNGTSWVLVTDTRVTAGLDDSGNVKRVISGVNLPTTGMVTGLNITQDYMGYYDATVGVEEWKAFIDKNGDFRFKGNESNYIEWDGATFQVNGVIISPNGTPSTATRLIMVGGEIAVQTGVTSANRFNFTTTRHNEINYYVWNVSSWNYDTNMVLGNGLGALTTGLNNIAIGLNALELSTTPSYNTAIGYRSMAYTTTGGENTALGYYSMHSNKTGIKNVAIGYNTLGAESGDQNVAVGHGSMLATFDTAYATAIDDCTAIGTRSLYATVGSRNTALGAMTGFGFGANSFGSNNLCAGYGAGYFGSPFEISTTQGSPTSNRIVLGDNNITNAYIKVAWTVTSDERDKTDISTLPYGLDFVNKLRPVSFKWDDRDNYYVYDIETKERTLLPRTGEFKGNKEFFGFISQEIHQLEKEFGFKNDVIADTEQEDKYLLKETALIPVLTKAIQELSAKVAELEAGYGMLMAPMVKAIQELSAKVAELEAKVGA